MPVVSTVLARRRCESRRRQAAAAGGVYQPDSESEWQPGSHGFFAGAPYRFKGGEWFFSYHPPAAPLRALGLGLGLWLIRESLKEGPKHVSKVGETFFLAVKMEGKINDPLKR